MLVADLSTGASVVSAMAALGALIFAWRTVKEAKEARQEAGAQAERQIAEMAAQVEVMHEANEAAARQHKIELDHGHVAQLQELAELLARARDAAAKTGGASQVELAGLGLRELLLSIQISVGALTASGYTCPPGAIEVVGFSGRQKANPVEISGACSTALLQIADAFSTWATDRTQEIKVRKGWTEPMQRR